MITLWATAAALVGIGLLPLCVMLFASVSVNGELSLQNYRETLWNPNTWVLFRNSLLLSTLTTATAAVIGIPLGMLVAKTELPFRTTLAIIFSLPLLFPPYIMAVGWFEVLGRGGLLSRWAGEAIGQTTSSWLFSIYGVTLVLTTAYVPVVLLLTATYLKSVSPSLEEAARLSSGWSYVLGRISLPLAAPGIMLSLLLVFLLAMAEYGAAAFLRLNVFPVASLTQFSAFYDFGRATAAAVPLILVAVLGLFFEQLVLRDKAYQFRWTGQSASLRIALGRKTPLICLATAILACVLVGVPIAALGRRGFSHGALQDAIERAGPSAVRSLVHASVSASLLTVLGLFLGYLTHRRAIRGWCFLDALSLFLFTLPGTILGVGMIALWNRPSLKWVYTTPIILVIGFLAQYSALSGRAILAGLHQVPTTSEDAAEVAGAGWLRRVSQILAPLLRPAILLAWTITFIFCLKDASLPLLLAPAGYDTLTARTLSLMANGSGELIAALCMLSMALALGAIALLGAALYVWRRVQ